MLLRYLTVKLRREKSDADLSDKFQEKLNIMHDFLKIYYCKLQIAYGWRGGWREI